MKLGCIEYSYKELPDGSTRPMTDDEKKVFKPTHVTTYGTKNGVPGAFTTDLQTNETVFTSLVPTHEDIMRVLGENPAL
jgi:hypothetical protein